VATRCTHLEQVQVLTPSSEGCEECLELGDTWIHLRMCTQCGQVGCCDNSKNRHASKHYRATGHPISRSLERGATWLYCYADEVFLSDEASQTEGGC
jgi:uncharacterized UBP type Zn finger protein